MSKKLFYIIFWTLQAVLWTGIVLIICNWSAETHTKAYYIGMLMESISAIITLAMVNFKDKIIKDNKDKTNL